MCVLDSNKDLKMLSRVNLTSAQLDNNGHRRCGNVRVCAHSSIYISSFWEPSKVCSQNWFIVNQRGEVDMCFAMLTFLLVQYVA